MRRGYWHCIHIGVEWNAVFRKRTSHLRGAESHVISGSAGELKWLEWSQEMDQSRYEERADVSPDQVEQDPKLREIFKIFLKTKNKQ